MIDKRILGTWRLRRTKAVNDDGEVLTPPLWAGSQRRGVLSGRRRMYSVLCDGRPELPTDEPRQSMSYTGNFTFDGTTLSTRVGASSDRAESVATTTQPAL